MKQPEAGVVYGAVVWPVVMFGISVVSGRVSSSNDSSVELPTMKKKTHAEASDITILQTY